MGGKSGQVSGYTYSMSIHMGLCRGPINQIVGIRVDSKNLTYSPSALGDGENIYLNDPYLFGGPQAEGGIVGGFITLFGGANQVLNNFLISLMKEPIPNFRGLVTCWYNGEVSCNNPYLKPWSFRCQRTTAGWFNDSCWYPAKATIPIAAINVEFYHQPTAGSTITLNGNVITYIAQNDVPVGAQLAGQASTALDAQVFMQYINANQDIYGLFATTNPSGADYVVTLTLVDSSPDAPIYTISTDATNFNPRILGGKLQGGDSIIAMNPAHVLYEACTDPQWGRGLPASMMDDEAFKKAADQLFNEGFGLNFKWSQTSSVSDFCRTVIEHISAALYISRLTGLMTLKLLRDDYDPAVIPFFDKNSGLISTENDGSSAQSTSFNQIIVNYHDPLQDVDGQIRAQNLASYKANQSNLSQTNSYPGIGSPALAARVALRDLQQQALGLKRFVLKFDQSARSLQVGDVFAFADLSRGISFMVMRIGQANYGTATDRTITMTCIQDVFSLPATGFTAVPVGGWTKPNNVPAVATQRLFQEANYRDLSHYLSGANLEAFPSGSGAITMLAANPNIVSGTYALFTSAGTGEPTVNNGAEPWCAAATVAAAIGLADETFVFANFTGNPFPAPPFAICVDLEWMRVDAVNLDDSILTVGRGCVDTVPMTHAIGANIFVADFVEGSDYLEYVGGETVNAQVCAITGQGILAQDLAPTDTLVIGARQYRPYPPGLVTVNGAPFSDMPFSPAGADLVLTWASRNRVLQADALVDQTMASVTPEDGTTYNIVVVYNGSPVRTVDGITALTWTYTAAEQTADGIGGLSYIQLQAQRDGVVSWTEYSIAIITPPFGYGYGYGTDYGVNT